MLKKKIKSLFVALSLSLLILPVIQTEAYSKSTNVAIEYKLEDNDSFLIYNLTDTEFAKLTKEEILKQAEEIYNKIKPQEINKKDLTLDNGDYLITNKLHNLSPIILKAVGEDTKVVGKHIKPPKEPDNEITTPPPTSEKPNKDIPKPKENSELSKTNTESVLFPLTVSVISTLIISLFVVLLNRKGDKDIEK